MAYDTPLPAPVVIAVVFSVLAITSVVARYYSRRLKNLSLQADDYIIIPALLFTLADAVLLLVAATNGDLGKHQPIDPNGTTTQTSKVVVFEQCEWLSLLLTPVAKCFTRYSILLFYRRIFTNEAFKIPVFVMYSINLLWGVTFFIAFLLSCTPISANWTVLSTQSTDCDNKDSTTYAFAISSVILDALVLAVPWPMVLKLKLSTRQKITVLSVFMHGALVIGVAIAKCVVLYHVGNVLQSNNDITYNDAPVFYLTIPETSIAVVSACLPTLRPFFQEIQSSNLVSSISSGFSWMSLHSSGDVGKCTNPSTTCPSFVDCRRSNNVSGFSKISEADRNIPTIPYLGLGEYSVFAESRNSNEARTGDIGWGLGMEDLERGDINGISVRREFGMKETDA